MRFLEISYKLAGAEADARPILCEVVTEFVPVRHYMLHQSLVAVDPLCDQEEGRPGLMAPQLSQDQGGRRGIGAIVQGQSDDRGLQRYPVETAGLTSG
jgi:hypothetical protein